MIAASFAAVALLAGCGGAQGDASGSSAGSSPAGYTDIAPAQLADMLKQKDFVLINTHIPYAGEIEQTDLFIPYDQAAELVGELPQDKAAEIVVYCRSDRMSRIAAQAWVEAGYTNISNLDGGFEAWDAAGYPLLQLDGQ
jgi:rhodanese-related sulfurtransferase